MHEALLYSQMGNDTVRCALCAHRCQIQPDKRGVCRVRLNEDGVLYSLVYGKVISQAVDPVEKKPLFHFLPGSASFSIAAPGCNFHCHFCQNWQISQAPRAANFEHIPYIEPEEIVASAHRYHCDSISYTYTEPTVFFEYAYDVAKLAAQASIANIFVTNGYMTNECLVLLGEKGINGKPLLSAANVDLKAWHDEVYRRYTGASVTPVLESLKLMKSLGIWVEVTTLIVPGMNDDNDQLTAIANFIHNELGKETPWHVSRFFPNYQMEDTAPTALDVVQRAREIGKEAGLLFVYTGNMPGGDGEDTFCPACNKKLIKRFGFRVVEKHIRYGKCLYCGSTVPGRWG